MNEVKRTPLSAGRTVLRQTTRWAVHSRPLHSLGASPSSFPPWSQEGKGAPARLPPLGETQGSFHAQKVPSKRPRERGWRQTHQTRHLPRRRRSECSMSSPAKEAKRPREQHRPLAWRALAVEVRLRCPALFHRHVRGRRQQLPALTQARAPRPAAGSVALVVAVAR